MSARREAMLLAVACILAYLTGAADIPFYTRGEPREGLVAREMLRTGEWLVPARPEGEPARKPPLYYWSAALALRALRGSPELALRLPSAAFATAAVYATWATARAVAGAAAGLPAALVLATAFEWTRAATSARVDMALAAALTAVLAGWTLVLARGRVRWLVATSAAATLAVLAKGPIGVVLPALAAAGAAVGAGRDLLRRLHPVPVLAAACVLAGGWYALAYARAGSAFLDVVARENWLRFVDPEGGATGHAHPTWYLVPLGLVGLLPWTPLLPLALAPLRRRPWPAPATLAVAWIVTGFVFFSLAAAKRSVYVLPLYPALALLMGAGIADPPPDGGLARATRLAARLFVPALALLALVAATYAAGLDPGTLLRGWLRPDDAAGAAILADAARAAGLAVGLLALGTAALVPLVRRAVEAADWRRLTLLLAAAAVVWTATFDAVFHPAIARARSVRAFLAHVDGIVPAEEPLYARFTPEYPPDPGLRFYAPRPLHPWPKRGLDGGGHLLLWEDEWRRLRDEHGQPLEVLAVSDARDPGRGHLALVVAPRGRLVPAPEPAPDAPREPGLRRGS